MFMTYDLWNDNSMFLNYGLRDWEMTAVDGSLHDIVFGYLKYQIIFVRYTLNEWAQMISLYICIRDC